MQFVAVLYQLWLVSFLKRITRFISKGPTFFSVLSMPLLRWLVQETREHRADVTPLRCSRFLKNGRVACIRLTCWPISFCD